MYQLFRVEQECHFDLGNLLKVFAINLKLYLIVNDLQSYASLDLLSLQYSYLYSNINKKFNIKCFNFTDSIFQD